MARSWHTRYRRIIDAYRVKLMEVDPGACDKVDDLMLRWEERWVIDERPIDPDRLMTAGEIAERFGLQAYDIRNWASRYPDKIPTHKAGRKALFRLRDVLKYRSDH